MSSGWGYPHSRATRWAARLAGRAPLPPAVPPAGARVASQRPLAPQRLARRHPPAYPLRRRLLPLPPRPRVRRRRGRPGVRERAHAGRGRALARFVLRAEPPGVGARSVVDLDVRQLDVRELALRDHDDIPDLALHRAQSRLLLRAEHVHGRDEPRARRVHGVPDRAAALPPRVGLQRLRRELRGRERRAERERAVQPVRRGAEHARGVRAHDRGPGDLPGEAPGGEGAVGHLSVRRQFRGDGHGQPLLARRRAGRARGRPVRVRRLRRVRACPPGGLGVAHRPGMSIRTGAEMRELARNRLIESRLTPNAISVTGLIGNLIAAVLILEHYFVLAGIPFILGSLCDMFDGRYSRMSGKGTPFGAFLDSTLDRVEEGIVLAAVAAWFAENSNEFAVGATVIAVVGSYMVSYTRARAEALGVECKVGIASRAVRVVILSAGLVFGAEELIPGLDLLEPAIYVMAALTVFTALQRVLHVRRQLAGGAGAV